MIFTNCRENRERTKTLTVMLRLRKDYGVTRRLLVHVFYLSIVFMWKSSRPSEREMRFSWGWCFLCLGPRDATAAAGWLVAMTRGRPREEKVLERRLRVSPVRSNSGTIAAVIERRFWRLTVKAAHHMWAAASPTSHKSYYYPSFKLVTAHHQIMSRVAFVPPIFGS